MIWIKISVENAAEKNERDILDRKIFDLKKPHVRVTKTPEQYDHISLDLEIVSDLTHAPKVKIKRNMGKLYSL